jgi:threonine dehydrogenase-like Zn-dependent dehydrogenase
MPAETIPAGHVFGHEFTGVIAGAYAESVAVPAGMLRRLPDTVSDADGALPLRSTAPGTRPAPR